MKVSELINLQFKHFNAATIVEAAKGWINLSKKNGKMFLTLAGAMSTAELGISIAELIRKDLICGICCTGANLEEDIFNLVAHDHYERIPHYRYLTIKDEKELCKRGLNRVTDTCIPEEKAFRAIERHMITLWKNADRENKRYTPHEFIYQLLESGLIDNSFQISPENSWVYAAWKKNLPIFVPGWEDSTLGNVFVSNVMKKEIEKVDVVKSGLEQMILLIDWYKKESKSPIGFFQIGGGIAGDFPICVVPLIHQDLKEECPLWSYFCQISDSTTSYGSYSGATPNEKITWGKIDEHTPSFIIESDATIVAPLIFHYVLENINNVAMEHDDTTVCYDLC